MFKNKTKYPIVLLHFRRRGRREAALLFASLNRDDSKPRWFQISLQPGGQFCDEFNSESESQMMMDAKNRTLATHRSHCPKCD